MSEWDDFEVSAPLPMPGREPSDLHKRNLAP